MRFRKTVPGLALLVCLSIAAVDSFAARGIIVGKPSGGSGTTAGKIYVTSTDSNDPRGIEPGGTIYFFEQVDVQEGDVASFEIIGRDTAIRIARIAKGTVVTTDTHFDMTIGSNQSVLVRGAGGLHGKVTVNGGTLVITESSRVVGKVEVAAGSFVLVEDGSTVSGANFKISSSGEGPVIILRNSHMNGKLSTSGAAFLRITDSIVDGGIASDGDRFVIIANNTIRGKLEVLNAKVCKCSNNTVDGKTITPGCEA